MVLLFLKLCGSWVTIREVATAVTTRIQVFVLLNPTAGEQQ